VCLFNQAFFLLYQEHVILLLHCCCVNVWFVTWSGTVPSRPWRWYSGSSWGSVHLFYFYTHIFLTCVWLLGLRDSYELMSQVPLILQVMLLLFQWRCCFLPLGLVLRNSLTYVYNIQLTEDFKDLFVLVEHWRILIVDCFVSFEKLAYIGI